MTTPTGPLALQYSRYDEETGDQQVRWECRCGLVGHWERGNYDGETAAIEDGSDHLANHPNHGA